MKLSLSTTHARVMAVVCGFALCVGLSARAQEAADQSLGDVARKTRQEHAAPHAASKQLVNEEEDGPDTTGVWRMHQCPRTPCYELTITLPRNPDKTPKWTRAAAEPRPVLIALPGVEEDANRVIRIYAAESLQPVYGWVDAATRQFLQGWLARPEYFGRAAHIVRQEQVPIDNQIAMLAQFTITPGAARYRGVSVVAGSTFGYYGFACVFREEDSKAAESICDAIVRSARNQALNPPPVTPVAPPDDPPGDDPQGIPQEDPQ
jgi:hypothetical protein